MKDNPKQILLDIDDFKENIEKINNSENRKYINFNPGLDYPCFLVYNYKNSSINIA